MVKNALGKSNFTYQKGMNGLASNFAQKMACLHNSGSTPRIFFLISHSERCQVVCENYVNGFLNSGPKMVLPHNFKSAWRSKVFFFIVKRTNMYIKMVLIVFLKKTLTLIVFLKKTLTWAKWLNQTHKWLAIIAQDLL